MRGLQSLLRRDVEISGSPTKEDGTKLKKIRSSGGQEVFVPGYVEDFNFQADKVQTEVINPGENADWANKHDYTLQVRTRDSLETATSVEKPRSRTVKDRT